MEPADPVFEGGHDIGPRREHVRVIPVGVEEHPDHRSEGIEVAGVLVGLDDGRLARPQPDDRRLGARQLGRQDGADERRRVESGPDQQVDQPAGRRRLAVGAGHRHEVAAPGRDRVGDELLAADSAGTPARCAAWSSGWSGSTEVSAFDTAIRSTTAAPSASTTWPDRARQAIGMPARVDRVAVAESAHPASQPLTRAPAASARRSEAEAAEPAAPTTWIRSPGSIGPAPEPARARGRSRRRCGSPPGGRVGHRAPAGGGGSGPGRFGGGDEQRRARPRRSTRLFAARSPDQTNRRTSTPAGVGEPEIGQADGLRLRCRRPARRCRSPRRRTSRPAARGRPSAIARATWALTAPWAASRSARHAELAGLHRVGVGHDPAEDVAARSGDVGQGVGDQAPGARLGGRDRPAARRGTAPGGARRARAGRRPSRRPAAAPSTHSATLSGGSSARARPAAANSHVSGIPDRPSLPIAVPLRVK